MAGAVKGYDAMAPAASWEAMVHSIRNLGCGIAPPHPRRSSFRRGQLRALRRGRASNYRQVPIGTVIPKDIDDVVKTVAAARRFGAPLPARGGGTSLAGQCRNVASSPPERSLLVLGYADVYRAADHIPEVLAHKPTALEGLDACADPGAHRLLWTERE